MPERTEAPTPRHLSEARSRGQVAHSPELNAALALLVGFWLLRGPGARLANALQQIMAETVSNLPTGELTGAWLWGVIVQDALRVGPDFGLILAGLMVTGVAATVAQIGLLWADKRPAVDWNRVNPLAGLRRIFSAHGLVAFGRALLKLIVVGWVAYGFLRGHVEAVLTLSQTDLFSALGRWADLAFGLALRVGGAYLILAVADYAYQRWQWTRSLRMSREEVKEDLKSSEGDPFLRGRIRQQQRRIARQRMLARVPKADVVITNPTHLAVALGYDRATMRAPRVLAKGAALVAQRIKDVARQHGVPIVEKPPVAQALYRAVEVDREIPPPLYVAIAEVLAFVYNLKARGKAQIPNPKAQSPNPNYQSPIADRSSSISNLPSAISHQPSTIRH
ncbi:MAG: flagellar biosynthesis protein FlhB [Chloroflexi bacterium]|nr:flagellar biosynthesis protein FlhB [Chloroflexota bacterium]